VFDVAQVNGIKIELRAVDVTIAFIDRKSTH
jgi:hypothetical protein